MLIPFVTHADDPIAIGADALLYVMAHDHTITIPTTALQFAEKGRRGRHCATRHTGRDAPGREPGDRRHRGHVAPSPRVGCHADNGRCTGSGDRTGRYGVRPTRAYAVTDSPA